MHMKPHRQPADLRSRNRAEDQDIWCSIDGKPECGGSFAKKSDADKKLTEMESAAQRGQWVDQNDQTTVTELVRNYNAIRIHKPRTAERAESLVRNHLEPTPLGGDVR